MGIDQLEGVLAALASPLTTAGEVDRVGVCRLVRHVLDGGVNGLVALGSTGECPALGLAAREALVSLVLGEVAGQCPVLAGVAQTSQAQAIEEVKRLGRLGAHAALVAPPFYYLLDQAAILAFYRAVAAAAPIPVLLYHFPQLTKVAATPDTVAELAREGIIAGIKDSSQDFNNLQRILVRTADLRPFRVFTGSDSQLLGALAMGAAGTIAGAVNVNPAPAVQLRAAFRAGDLAAARRCQAEVLALVDAVRIGVFPAGIKAALDLLGICGPTTAAPLQPLPPAERARLRADLQRLGLLRSMPITPP